MVFIMTTLAMVVLDCCLVPSYCSFRHVLRNLPLRIAVEPFCVDRLGFVSPVRAEA